ncbi:3013_t:CDS:2, partial [Gigaspora rosea]
MATTGCPFNQVIGNLKRKHAGPFRIARNLKTFYPLNSEASLEKFNN